MNKLDLIKLISIIQDWFADHNQATEDCKQYLKLRGIEDGVINDFFVEE